MINEDQMAEVEALEAESREPAFDLRDRTFDFALRIIRLFSALPQTEETRFLGEQLLRSGTAVGADYREAHRGRAKPEFVAKIADCLKSLDQTAYWLDLLIHANVVPAARLSSLQDETHQLIAIFVTISKRTKASL
jgi:four helix bundle protein